MSTHDLFAVANLLVLRLFSVCLLAVVYEQKLNVAYRIDTPCGPSGTKI